MKVRALRAGYDGFQRQAEGSIFEWPNDKDGKPKKLGSWVEAVEKDEAGKKADAEADKERARAEHARLQREAIGQILPQDQAGKKA
jgi:hypothetical protein